MNPIGYLETGVLYCDDNLERLTRLPAESIDLIYLDPPFFSNRDYEVIWGDEAEVRSFEDSWEGGKARAANMTPEERSEAARKAVNARWEKWRRERQQESSEGE